MTINQLLIVLQNPITVLLISTVCSWLLINLVWNPYQKRMETRQNLNLYRNEVFSRLTALQIACDKKWSNGRIIDFLYGNVSVNKNLKEWKISYLVHYCWSEMVYTKTISTLSELEKLAQENQKWPNEEKIKKSKQLLDSLLQLLENHK